MSYLIGEDDDNPCAMEGYSVGAPSLPRLDRRLPAQFINDGLSMLFRPLAPAINMVDSRVLDNKMKRLLIERPADALLTIGRPVEAIIVHVVDNVNRKLAAARIPIPSILNLNPRLSGDMQYSTSDRDFIRRIRTTLIFMAQSLFFPPLFAPALAEELARQGVKDASSIVNSIYNMMRQFPRPPGFPALPSPNSVAQGILNALPGGGPPKPTVWVQTGFKTPIPGGPRFPIPGEGYWKEVSGFSVGADPSCSGTLGPWGASGWSVGVYEVLIVGGLTAVTDVAVAAITATGASTSAAIPPSINVINKKVNGDQEVKLAEIKARGGSEGGAISDLQNKKSSAAAREADCIAKGDTAGAAAAHREVEVAQEALAIIVSDDSGLSTTTKIAIGVGIAAVVGGGVYLATRK